MSHRGKFLSGPPLPSPCLAGGEGVVPRACHIFCQPHSYISWTTFRRQRPATETLLQSGQSRPGLQLYNLVRRHPFSTCKCVHGHMPGKSGPITPHSISLRRPADLSPSITPSSKTLPGLEPSRSFPWAIQSHSDFRDWLQPAFLHSHQTPCLSSTPGRGLSSQMQVAEVSS